jgi:uncharacterized protein (DUF952 family)
MDEARLLANIYSLTAKMYSVIANVEGMVAENAARERRGYAHAWDEAQFADAANELETISQDLLVLSKAP